MRIQEDYLVLDPFDFLKYDYKISAHNFVYLLGLDNFNKPGDALLNIFGFYKSKVDPKWLKRGSFAEKIVKQVYERDGHKCTTYNAKEIGYNCFNKPPFCGVIDIELLEEKTLVEVKSKNVKDYDYIRNNPPLNEVYQGLLYGYLRDYSQIVMEWIFFDTETENQIFNDQPITTLKNLKRHQATFPVDKNTMEECVTKAIEIVKNFKETRKIHLSEISEKTLQELISKGKIKEV